MQLIDTHSHLYSDKFDSDRSDVVRNAIKNSVSTILLPNISSKYTSSMLDLCSRFPVNCLPMMGVHPCEINEKNYKHEIEHVEKELTTKKYIAVGEIGIDLYWYKSTFEIQKKAFIHQIELAKKYNLPIVIHVRNAFEETIEIVEKYNSNKLRGVFHCFTGSINEANRVLELQDFFLGIGGVLTFKNSGLDKTIKELELEKILLETDSPYLAPTPFRGKRNESKYLLNITEKLAEIHNITIEEVADITTKNAKILFRL